MINEFTLTGVFTGVALCLATHGVFAATGFETSIAEFFGNDPHVH